MRLEELIERVWLARNEMLRSHLDVRNIKVHLNAGEHRAVESEVVSGVSYGGVWRPTGGKGRVSNLFGMEVVADPSIPVGKIVLRVEVEA